MGWEKSLKLVRAEVVQRLECFLAKEEVAGSNPVFRSSKSGGVAKRLRQGSAKPPYGGSNPPAASKSAVNPKQQIAIGKPKTAFISACSSQAYRPFVVGDAT